MDEQKYKDDLKDIKEIMDRSSRFLSLSGWSGISTGILALIAAYLARDILSSSGIYSDRMVAGISETEIVRIVIIGLITLVSSIGAGLYFTRRVAKKSNQHLWDMQAKRLLINLLIPLSAGGICCLILISKGYIILVAPLTLLFYGLSLINASKYTLPAIRGLGIIEIGLGLLALWFTGYGLLFWAIGFGIAHIGYGIFMQMKYGS